MKMKTFQVFAVALVVVSQSNGLRSVPVCTSKRPLSRSTSSSGNPRIPKLPNEYEINIEATVAQQGYTVDSTELCMDNLRSITFTKKGTKIQRLLFFPNRAYEIYHNTGKCRTKTLTNRARNDYFSSLLSVEQIKSVKDIFDYVSRLDYQYIGTTYVRGIAANHWSSCLHIAEKNLTLRFELYFSSSNYTSAGGLSNIPLRLIVNGSSSNANGNGRQPSEAKPISVQYEFTSFHTSVSDVMAFQVPRGIFCSGIERKLLPKFPEQASFEMEIYSSFKIIQNTRKISYDMSAGLFRIDKYVSRQHSRKYLVDVVKDYKNGVEYVIDTYRKNCTIHGLSNITKPNIPRSTQVPEVLTLFDVMKSGMAYQGKKIVRGLSVDAWGKIDSKTKTVYEVYFQGSNLIKRSGSLTNRTNSATGHNRDKMLIGMYMSLVNPVSDSKWRTFNPTSSNFKTDSKTEMFVNVFNYNEGLLDPDVFDVRCCYGNNHDYEDVQLSIESLPFDVYRQNKDVILDAVHRSVSKAAKTSLTRVSGLRVEKEGPKLVAHFTLLGPPTLAAITNKQTSQPDLQQAHDNLKRKVSDGMNLKLKLMFKEETKENEMTMKDVITTPNAPAYVSQAYDIGCGTVVGVGVSMLILGLLVGLVISFLIYKRMVRPVPYLVTK